MSLFTLCDLPKFSAASIPILKQLLIRYMFSLGVTFVLTLAFLVIGLLFLQGNDSFGATVNAAAIRYLVRLAT